MQVSSLPALRYLYVCQFDKYGETLVDITQLALEKLPRLERAPCVSGWGDFMEVLRAPAGGLIACAARLSVVQVRYLLEVLSQRRPLWAREPGGLVQEWMNFTP